MPATVLCAWDAFPVLKQFTNLLTQGTYQQPTRVHILIAFEDMWRHIGEWHICRKKWRPRKVNIFSQSHIISGRARFWLPAFLPGLTAQPARTLAESLALGSPERGGRGVSGLTLISAQCLWATAEGEGTSSIPLTTLLTQGLSNVRKIRIYFFKVYFRFQI